MQPEILPPVPPVTPTVEITTEQKDYNDVMMFSSAKARLQQMVSDFQPQVNRVKQNWKDRYKEVETAQLRKAGMIPQYAHMVPVRSIDANIRRQQPAYVNYLKQSRRLAILKAINNPSTTTTLLEDEFTRGMTYSGWEVPFFKTIDGSQTHGWDWMECVFDLTKPFNYGFEHIGCERLIFPLDAQDIQACEMVIRAITVTPKQLKVFVTKFNFDSAQVNKLTTALEGKRQKERSILIYKMFCKFEGFVYTAWFSLECDDWLLKPDYLFMGRRKQVVKTVPVPQQVPSVGMFGEPTVITQQVPTPMAVWEDEKETQYPIFLLPYAENAQHCIVNHPGRVMLDKPKQEARTANLSQFLSTCQLAATPVFSPDPNANASTKDMENVKFGNGKIIPFAIKNANVNYPDSTMLALQNYLDTFDSQEAGQTNYAANNRQDSRKTATEVAAAREDADKLSNVEITLFSKFLRDVWTYTWSLVQNRAVQGKITLLADPNTGANNVEFINQPFDVRAAGDIDVVKKQEMLAQYKDFWAIIKDTPIALQYLAKMLVLTFPEDGNYFADQLMLGDPRIVVGQLATVLQSSIDATEWASLSPQNQMNLQNLLQQAAAMAASVENQSITNNPSKQPPANNGKPSAPPMAQAGQ